MIKQELDNNLHYSNGWSLEGKRDFVFGLKVPTNQVESNFVITFRSINNQTPVIFWKKNETKKQRNQNLD